MTQQQSISIQSIRVNRSGQIITPQPIWEPAMSVPVSTNR